MDGEDDILSHIVQVAMEVQPDSKGRIRLPTERDLAQRLGIQRPTLRDRLTVLETLGLIERVQGSGTYLALPNARFLRLHVEVAHKLGFISLEQIQTAMEMIGREVAAGAAIQATPADFAKLERLVDQIAEAADINELIDRQFELHAGLVAACHNPVMALIMDALSSVVRSLIASKLRIITMVSGAFERNVEVYRALIDALQAREPELARGAVQECYWLWRREEAKVTDLWLG